VLFTTGNCREEGKREIWEKTKKQESAVILPSSEPAENNSSNNNNGCNIVQCEL
jgi:hypothetical protein